MAFKKLKLGIGGHNPSEHPTNEKLTIQQNQYPWNPHIKYLRQQESPDCTTI